MTALPLYTTAMLAANRAAGTVKLHAHYLRLLERAHPSTPWDVTTADLRAVMGNPSWGPNARKSARTVYRGFYRWAHGSGYIEDDPALGLEPVPVPVKVSNPTPETIVRQLLHDGDQRLAFLSLLGACLGMRCGEIARVHSSDYNRYEDELLVHGKGNRERLLMIEDDRLRMFLLGVDGWAFPNRQGGHLSPGHVSRLLSRAQPERWTAHSLRHRAANEAHEATRDIRAVQDMLGHAQVTTTQGYLRVTREALRAALRGAAAINRPGAA